MASKVNSSIQIFDPDEYLDRLGGLDDREIDTALGALALSTKSHDGISIHRYLHHLETLKTDVAQEYEREEARDVGAQLCVLKSVLCDRYGYDGDAQTYEDLQNSSLIRVIDRAKGLPISLCILYIHAARGQGWNIEGIDMPGHFVCRLELDGHRVIFDPFNGCKVLEAPDLREIVKKSLGADAELSAAYFEPASNRDILIRLQNNIKFRQIAVEDYESALQTVLLMRKIDPDGYRLLLDEGVLLARTDQPKAAVDSLILYVEKAPNSRDRMEAELLLQQLHEHLD